MRHCRYPARCVYLSPPSPASPAAGCALQHHAVPPFRRLLGHRKTESRTLDTPVVRSRTARVSALGDRTVSGTATFSVNEHRHDGPQVFPTLNNDLGGRCGPPVPRAGLQMAAASLAAVRPGHRHRAVRPRIARGTGRAQPGAGGHPVLRADRLPAHRPVHVRDQPRPAGDRGAADQRRRHVPQLLPRNSPGAGSPPRIASHRSGKREGTMTYPTDPRVDAYIDALPAWQQTIYRQVRDLVHAADPGSPKPSSAPPAPTSCWTATSAPCKQPRTMSTSSSMTAPSSPTPRASSQAGMTTRPPVRWPSATARPSTRAHCRVPADHRRQPGRRLAQAQARNLTRRSGPAPAAPRRRTDPPDMSPPMPNTGNRQYRSDRRLFARARED